jgi:hypothetical protein
LEPGVPEDGHLSAFANSPFPQLQIAMLTDAYERTLQKLSLVDRNDPLTEIIAKKVRPDAQASYLQTLSEQAQQASYDQKRPHQGGGFKLIDEMRKKAGSNRSCRRKSIFAKGGRDTRDGSGKKKGSGRSVEEVHPSAAKSAVLVEKIGQPPTLKA